MNILMIYPKYPDTYWSFKHALRFVSKKAAVPPLGLITASAMLPGSWNKKLVDINVSQVKDSDMIWADYVMISAMYIQKTSVAEVIEKCKQNNVKIIAGGPLFTREYNNYPQIDHFILNEAEITLPLFLADLDTGRKPRKVYKTDQYADLSFTPVPDFHLLEKKAYAFMSIQVSRGCPYACDFCEITALLGRKVRMKSTQQVIDEMQTLHDLGWKGSVFIVDDNFIGRKKEVKNNLLPAMNKWMKVHKMPFIFNTQTSIDIADDEELLNLMLDTQFRSTFIGIETPMEESLEECNKVQNKNRDMLQSIKKLQKAGMQVSGGFIVGFDNDTPSIFERQINFIEQSGIVSAMVGLLNAPKNTKLYQRLEFEERLTTDATGSNTDYSMNFIPKMNMSDLQEGYQKIIKNLYSVRPFYKRLRRFLLDYSPPLEENKKIQFLHLVAFFKLLFVVGIINKGRREFWRFLAWTIIHRPGSFLDAITFTVYGFHFRIVYGLRKIKIS